MEKKMELFYKLLFSSSHYNYCWSSKTLLVKPHRNNNMSNVKHEHRRMVLNSPFPGTRKNEGSKTTASNKQQSQRFF
jgi:hypothetical protein